MAWPRYLEYIGHTKMLGDSHIYWSGSKPQNPANWRLASGKFPHYSGSFLGVPLPEKLKSKLDRSAVFVSDNTKQVVIVTAGMGTRMMATMAKATTSKKGKTNAALQGIASILDDLYVVLRCVHSLVCPPDTGMVCPATERALPSSRGSSVVTHQPIGRSTEHGTSFVGDRSAALVGLAGLWA